MGYDLGGAGGHFQWNVAGWRHVLKLAHNNGWEPSGTEPPALVDEDGNKLQDDHDWDGSYFGNDLQVVAADDASNLADALERGLPDLSDEELVKKQLPEFIAFCRAGSFRIG